MSLSGPSHDLPRIKICGITNAEDAIAAVEAGADALGFVFHAASPRAIAPDVAREIVAVLPETILTVGVFVNEEPARVAEIMDRCRLALAQLHGDETAAYCEQLGRPVLRALRLRGLDSFLALAEYQGRAGVRGFVIDAFSETKYGGTGQTTDWTLAAEAARNTTVVLAGGLTAQNVGQAIRTVRPYGVDVSSGVEVSPGKKDPAKIAAFINAAKIVRETAERYTP